MLKQLKIKFIINNILLAGIVLLLIFSFLCIVIYFGEEIKITAELNNNIKASISSLPTLPDEPHESDTRVYNMSFTVLINKSGDIVSKTEIDITPSELRDSVDIALQAENARGNILSAGLSFMKTETREGTLISFVSREHLNERIRESITQLSLTMLISLLLFLYISKRAADMAIEPIEKAWEQQKQFLADASHDLKTPLTVILANNNIISAHKEESVASQMKWIESTSEEAGRMSDLINKMLELAKGEASKEELSFGEVDISELVEKSILQFEVVAFEKNLKIESGIQPNIIVKTHAMTFSKILEILFDNAIKYSDDNGSISIALYQSSKKVYFTINNKGEYIKENELSHIFERFYRTNKEREVGGHGLGLSLARKKCEMLGHKISVESNEEEGTTFTIIIKAKNK